MEITRFISRKQVRTVAQPLNISLVQPAPVSVEFREQMIARLEQLQFRPRLSAGRPVEASATLIYLSAPAARKFIDTLSNASGDGSLTA